jgi:dTDP-4-amino-4,6-dideoxygalactose transaminase
MKIEVYSPTIRRKEMDAVLTAMVEDKIGPGERARQLLSTAKEYLHFDYALSLRSPAIALTLALKALNPEKGQGVIISALSPRYYVNVITDMGLSVLYCDVSPNFPCMSRETIEQALAERLSGINVLCIILHHTLGYVPDTASVAEIGLPVIEDVSMSVNFSGGKADANQNETAKENRHGVFTILGLEERDMLTAGGGAILFAANRRDGMLLRNFTDIPPEFCLPDINAALAVVQFKEARRNIEKRVAIAQMYVQSALRTRHKRFIPLTCSNERRSLDLITADEVSDTGGVSGDDTEYNNFAFSMVLETGLKDVLAYARKKDIILESAFDNTVAGVSESGALNCPVSYSLSLRTVLFPLYPRLRQAEAERVSKLIATLP